MKVILSSVVTITENHINDAATCSICQEAFELDVLSRRFLCPHIFHAECIIPWLSRKNRTCPLCRRKIVTDTNCYIIEKYSHSNRHRDRVVLLSVRTPPGCVLPELIVMISSAE